MTTCSPLLGAVDGFPGHREALGFKPTSAVPVKAAGRPAHSKSTIERQTTVDDREALFDDFAPLVRRLIRQYGGEDPEMREDMRGEIYYRFCQLCAEYDPERGIPLHPYLVRKLTASAYTYARQRWRRDRRELTLEFTDEMADQGPASDPTMSWDHALAMESMLNVLPAGINLLPRRQRQVVIWRYYEQRSFEEIAERLSIQVSTARSMVRHGLNNLRKWIQREKLDWEG